MFAVVSLVMMSQVTINCIDGHDEPGHGWGANTAVAVVSMVVVSQVTANCIDGYGEPGYCWGANTAVAVVSMVVSLSDTYWSIYLPVNQQIDIKTARQYFTHFTPFS